MSYKFNIVFQIEKIGKIVTDTKKTVIFDVTLET